MAMGALKNDKAARGDGRVRIQVTIPDGRYVSGGPFCCFVKVAPIISDSADSKGPVTVDFIAINVYGRVCFRNKLLDISKIQSSLRFGFLTEERETLNNNDNVHLIFSSDAVIFCTGTEITNSSSETFYRFTCTIPPFIPPTVDGEDVSCNYYVDVTVQYNANSQSHHRETIRGKVEFRIVGSIYRGVPTLDDVYHPFLPKSNGYSLEEGNIRDDTISQLYLDCTAHTKGPRNMFFNYESRVDALDSGNSTNQSPDTFLLSNDLNAFWRVWDTMNGSGLNHEPEESAILRHYNDFVEKFTALITNDSTSKEVEKFRAWFGTVLSTDSCNTGDEVLPSDRKSILEKLVEKVGNQTEIKHGVRIAGLERAAAESLAMQMDVSSDDSIKVMSFSLAGKRLCTCNFQGFSQIEGENEFTLPVDSWFTIFFDFMDAFRCLQVDICIMRTDEAGASDLRTSNSCVLQRSLFTLGKSRSSVTLFLPISTTPSFICSFLKVSYKMELCFYHFIEPVDLMKPDGMRAELHKLQMLKWSNPIRLLQSESVRVRSRCFVREEAEPMEKTLQLAKTLCDRPNMPQLLASAPTLAASFTIH